MKPNDSLQLWRFHGKFTGKRKNFEEISGYSVHRIGNRTAYGVLHTVPCKKAAHYWAISAIQSLCIRVLRVVGRSPSILRISAVIRDVIVIVVDLRAICLHTSKGASIVISLLVHLGARRRPPRQSRSRAHPDVELRLQCESQSTFFCLLTYDYF